MFEDIGCERSFEEGLLNSVSENFKDWTKAGKRKSFYSSLHASTLENERRAEDKHERKASKSYFEFSQSFNEMIKLPGNEEIQSSLYSSRHISTQHLEKVAEAIVAKNQKEIKYWNWSIPLVCLCFVTLSSFSK